MRTGRKILLSVLLIGLCAANGYARSAGTDKDNISEQIELTLTQSETPNAACESARRSVSNRCGQTYIYPVISNHPNNQVATKINTFIRDWDQHASDDYARTESWTEAVLNRQNILSLSYSRQFYGRAALADQAVQICKNIDLATGDDFALSDVLVQGFRTTLPRLLFENLETKLKYKIPGYVHSILATKGANWTLSPNQSFLLSEQDLNLCFDHGALSDETVGPIIIPLPYELVSGLIDEDGPLKFMREHQKSTDEVESSIAQSDVAASKIIENVPAAPQPADVSATSSSEASGFPMASTEYTCFKENVTHKITIVEYDQDSPFICTVEYDKGYEKKTLWRSRKTNLFCIESVEKLIAKYEEQWGYTCGR